MTSNLEEVVIRCQGITKAYGTGPAGVVALRGIDLEVYRGELLMLVGPSGCGKTTLISIISAILDQDEGQCEVFGRNLISLVPEEREQFRGESVGFVFQLFNLLPALTAQENVAVPLLIQGIPRKQAMEKAYAVLDSVNLAKRYDALPGQLSGGQQQRVAIARALVHDPKLIVCDEPTSSLDHKTGHEMISLLRDIAKQNDRTMVIVTHDTRILEFADRIAQMDDGRVVGFGMNGEGV